MIYDLMTIKYAYIERRCMGLHPCDKRFTSEKEKTRNRRLDLPKPL